MSSKTVDLSQPDSSYQSANNELADNRHFELNLFTQFDFTYRFSASIGVGYSSSKTTTEVSGSSASSLDSKPQSSTLNLITLPIQAKFMLVSKKRFALNAGITLQTEFGKINYSEKEVEESWTVTSNPNPMLNESFANGKSNFRQYSAEPFMQVSFDASPRFSVFVNGGYRMYLNQLNKEVTPIGRLNYFNTDVGLLFKLR